jgi:hypothetical protein
MAYKFNPFTDTLDIVGSGGGSYIDGEVEYHSNLPVTVGTPAVNSAFLVRKGEGLYFISRKPAGIWVRELNNGNLDDWKYAGTFSDLYRDANFRIINDTDTSKELAFSLSGITTGTTRTLTVPDASGTIALTSDFAAPPAIGSTTPNTLAGTQLALHDGSDTGTFVAASKLSANRTYDLPDASGTIALTSLVGASAELVIACSDEATNLTTGTAKVTFRMPYAMTLSSVRASVNTAPTGSTLVVDINEGGSTILSTKLSIDASELTSTTAATAAVISDTALADDAEVTIDIDQIGSTIAGKGLKVVLKGTRA